MSDIHNAGNTQGQVNNPNVHGNLNVNIAGPKDYPHDLNYIPPIEIDKEAIGREQAIIDVHKCLTASPKVAVVRGIGGMGKTTLVKAYVTSHRADYAHIAWIGSSENLVASVANDAQLHANLGLDFKDELPEDRFCKVMLALNQIPGDNLLVLDNAETTLADTPINNKPLAQWLPGSHWKKIATSREHLTGFHEYALQRLEPDRAVELFRLHYKSDDKDSDILALIELIDYHTLTLEILAKTLAKDRGRGNITLAKVYDSIANHRLHDDELQKKIELEHPGDNTGIYLHLLGAFDVVKLDDAETAALQLFLLLPTDGLVENAGHPLSFFEGDFPLPEILKPDYVEVFDNLVDKGWLERDAENRYKLHRLLREVLLYKIKPSVEEADVYICYVVDLFDFDVTTDFSQLIPKLPIGDTVEELFRGTENLLVARLQNQMGEVYRHAGNYKKASELLESSLKTNFALFGNTDSNVATCRMNLGNIYNVIGRCDEAASLLEMVLDSDIANFGETDSKIAGIKSNLATVYFKMERHAEAILLLEDAIEINIANLGDSHPTVAIFRSNLAAVYDKIGRRSEAIKLLEAALQSDIINLGASHPNVSIRRTNLANIYRNIGRHAEAIQLLEPALANDVANFGESNPIVAIHKSGLANVYADIGRYTEAAELFEAAIRSDLASFGESYPDVASNFNNLALVFVALGKYQEAVEHFHFAITVLKNAFGEKHPNIDTTFENILATISQGAAAGDPAMLALQAEMEKENGAAQAPDP